MHFPRTLDEWAEEFNDDLGFEPIDVPKPTDAAPGSPDKIAILRERMERGQRLFHARDCFRGNPDMRYEDNPITFSFVGSEKYGAVVGFDFDNHKHRYAIWTECKPAKLTGRMKPQKLLYVPATASYVDSFEKDPELAAIKKHAEANNAEFVAVVSLFSARVYTERELAKINYPVTELGYQWLRWLARRVNKVVVCWGETPSLDRYADVLWLLNRTCSCQIYSLSESEKWPPPVNRLSEPLIHRYDSKSIIAERLALEEELESLDGAG